MSRGAAVIQTKADLQAPPPFLFPVSSSSPHQTAASCQVSAELKILSCCEIQS